MTDFNRNTPIYLQITAEITKKILAGSYQTGEKLPSVRDIATAEGVNPNTAQRALAALEAEGLVVTERTSGRFVTKNEDLIDKKRIDTAKQLIEEFKANMREIGFPEEKLLTLFKGGK